MGERHQCAQRVARVGGARRHELLDGAVTHAGEIGHHLVTVRIRVQVKDRVNSRVRIGIGLGSG